MPERPERTGPEAGTIVRVLADAEAVFVRDESGRLLPTPRALSPWGSHLLHGGAVTGALALAAWKELEGLGLGLRRLTVDLFRPVEAAPIEVACSVVRTGRRLALLELTLLSNGRASARAAALGLRGDDGPWVGGADAVPLPAPERLRSEPRVVSPALRPGFHTTLEVRGLERQEGEGSVEARAWVRLPCPLVAGEEVPSLAVAAAVADFANGLAHVRLGTGLGFINADVTFLAARAPRGEWIGVQAHSRVTAGGLGRIESRFFDEDGEFGCGLQTILANRRNEEG